MHLPRHAALALALATFVGCAPPAERAHGPVGRIVSLAPSSTEILFALGAGDRVVGVCAQCDAPAEAKRVAQVGGYLAPSVEAVLAVRPDLVVAVPSPGNREAVRAMERAGIRVLIVGDRTLADLWAATRSIADVLGTPQAGERLTATMQGELADVRARVAALPPRRVLVVVGHTPLVAVGGGTLQDELVTLAGGVNVAADAGEVWPTIGLELVIARAPDVIVDAAMGSEAGSRALFAGLTTVPAVQQGRVVRLPDDAFLRAGPRVAAAARLLATVIHPEAFGAARSG